MFLLLMEVVCPTKSVGNVSAQSSVTRCVCAVAYPSAELTMSAAIIFTHQLTANQLVQSHTPIKKVAGQYADKDVLVIGGRRDACRRVAQS
jgi:hypothetical protein